MSDVSVSSAYRHRLEVETIELVGGGREVSFRPGVNYIRGEITTGKSTLVKLLRGMLGRMPGHLPPETQVIRAIAGRVVLGERKWDIYRPAVTTADAAVEVAERVDDDSDGLALRLEATGSGGYGDFLLQQIHLPVVSVPRARQDPEAALSPVTINDWLGYCIIPGDELDVQVFGHREPFRDAKRRWVFEIAYGLYDEELAKKVAELRRLEAEIRSAEAERLIIDGFLANSTFEEREVVAREQHKAAMALEAARSQVASDEIEPASAIAQTRARVLELRSAVDASLEEVRMLDRQRRELADLERQLESQSRRLTRAIVTEEWMVDFEFVVCPRCGNNVDAHRSGHGICYLCEQAEPTEQPNRDSLIKEQDRTTSQLNETRELISERAAVAKAARGAHADAESRLRAASLELDDLTRSFVSSRSDQIERRASSIAKYQADVEWLTRVMSLFDQRGEQSDRVSDLRRKAVQLSAEVDEYRIAVADADENIKALERRMLEYLERLHVPVIGDMLSVRINTTTWLPEVSGRSFDELSSQGLKTLVNVAHSLAHHTTALDRELPLPSLLVLDGVSANSGREGLDGDRISDMFALFEEVAQEYVGRLQLIVVDNELPGWVLGHSGDRVALTLSHNDRLIRAEAERVGTLSEADM
jgi:energy-coupling factor transporter ATP-binding protein EcfA2